MKWNALVGAVVISAGLCQPSFGFEWLDRLIGIDLDNSEASSTYSPYSAGYTPYATAYPAQSSSSTGYAPYTTAYPPAASYGYSNYAPAYGRTPQTSYRMVYQQVPVQGWQPVITCDQYGNQVTVMRPVITYRMQAQAVPYTGQ